MKKKNITLSMDTEIIKKGKKIAIDKDITFSKLIEDLISNYVKYNVSVEIENVEKIEVENDRT